MEYLRQNRSAWDSLSKGSEFSHVATDAEVANPLGTLDSRGWLPGRVDGLKVLCLAAGGGWQSILYAAAGAQVTVVDISPGMLDLDRQEADRRGFQVDVIECSMDEIPMDDMTFDIVHQPVSTCYIPRVADVYREVSRLLVDKGLYISQHKSPTSLQITSHDAYGRYMLSIEQFHSGPLPNAQDTSYRETGATEYLHTYHELVGGLCRAGFVLEDLVEPRRVDPAAKPGQIGHRGRFVSPYLRLKARRQRTFAGPATQQRIWTPEP